MEVSNEVEEEFYGFLPEQEHIDAHDFGDNDVQHDLSKEVTVLIHEKLQACHGNKITSGSEDFVHAEHALASEMEEDSLTLCDGNNDAAEDE